MNKTSDEISGCNSIIQVDSVETGLSLVHVRFDIIIKLIKIKQQSFLMSHNYSSNLYLHFKMCLKILSS